MKYNINSKYFAINNIFGMNSISVYMESTSMKNYQEVIKSY